VGTYDHTDPFAIRHSPFAIRDAAALSKQTKVPLTNLSKTFGIYNFTKFTAAFPYLVDGLNSPFELLEKID
jgi:hypothetical protein